MLDTKIKIEIAKEVITKMGYADNKDAAQSIAEAMMDERFIFDLRNNEVAFFIAWEKPQLISGKKTVFVKSLFIDPKYRNGKYVIKIRGILKLILKADKYIWFNRRKQKLVERI